ncbi:alpha/beta-hydrolase [Cryphonectria parasitica EP155]|uniref:Alpha/beta-hydrolase n=1 Tax=Cryphonectria parasitica (strain ATCC 38755 / EP155) TaxID=660469 RepID=A0A9P5CKY1_CRYP1|nr:alpha/beta-hydrolase [Cryphonectria parasitica EP155]KAF3762754.1 alpha/beta-hydrolase [Cryphonectria parasitica EP155]
MVWEEVVSGKSCTSETWTQRIQHDRALRKRPILLYLCGGPGADNPPCRVREMNRWLLMKGYSILYVDYRGCGDSSPLPSQILSQRADLDQHKMAHYIAQFCQDNIVRDLEAIRLCLSQLEPLGEVIKWTTLGQSYGGYISLSYLSMHPEGLSEVFITGGLPPCGMKIEDYFQIEYENIVEQNQRFYSHFQDADILVRRILTLITNIGPKNIPMTGRGYMTGQKLLTLGRQFGSKVGFPEVYNLLCTIKKDLETVGRLQPDTIHEFESILHIDERPLYPLLLEQTWCSGGPTRWAAERVARKIRGFEYLQASEDGTYPDPSLTATEHPIYFTANTYCRFHYDTHEELIELKEAAELLAEYDWECPYDFEKLMANPLGVPVYAISFERDMHLDVGVSARTAAMVGGLTLVIDPGWHQDIRYRPAEVLENLFQKRDTAMRWRAAASSRQAETSVGQ